MATRRTPVRRRRTSYAGRRRGAPVVSHHKVISRGSTILNGSDPETSINLTSLVTSPESSTFYNKDLSVRGNSVVGVRGSWWYWSDVPADLVQTQGWLGVGLISMNLDVVTQLNEAPERTAVGPLDLEGRYRPWHYRRTVPVMSRGSVTDQPYFDQADQMIQNRQGIGVRRAEKFMSVRDGYYLFGQVDSSVTFDVGIAWQLQFYIREP